MMRIGRVLVVLIASVIGLSRTNSADLRGHGGPVRAIAIDLSGAIATAGFDAAVIRWDEARGTAKAVLRFHEGAVNALLALPDGALASAGEDRRIALWGKDSTTPLRHLEGHTAPISALALSPNGHVIASASWDGTVRLWPLAGGPSRIIEGHRGPVNAVLFLPDGTPVSAGYDGSLRLHHDAQPVVLELGFPINAIVRAGYEIFAAGADGQLHIIDWRRGQVDASLPIADVPIVALATAPDGNMLAAAGFRGALVLLNAQTRTIERKLVGPAFPLWSLAFSLDGRDILTGGADRLVRRWSVKTGEPVNPVLTDAEPLLPKGLETHPGLEIYKACQACHTLSDHDGVRAGPTLHKVMGRKIATAPGYRFSDALVQRDLVWSRETIARLFEIGPNAMLPGTKMPEQLITNRDEREALVDFIEKASR